MVDSVQIRPKLKQDSVFIQTDDGVFLRSDESTFLLKGKNIYHWLSVLMPHMTGQYSLDELCERLDDGQRKLVTRLVTTLLERGILKSHIVEDRKILPDAVASHFHSQIEFIEHYTDHAQQKFHVFRESRLLLIGSGEAFLALALVLVRNGAGKLFLRPTDAQTLYEEKVAQEVEVLRQSGIETKVSIAAAQAEELSLPADAYDLVIYCSDENSLSDIARLNKRCIEAGIAFLPATIVSGKALIGPYVKPGGHPCWLCAQLRLATNSNDSQALWRNLAVGNAFACDETPFFSALARRVGAGLGFEVFKLRASHLPSETENGVIIQDLETLEAYRAELLPHPLCPLCSQQSVESAIQYLLNLVEGKCDRELSLDDILQQSARYINPHLGLWNQFTDDDIVQVPIKASRLRFGSPTALHLQAEEVTAFAIDSVLEARRATLYRAATEYAQHLADARGMTRASYNELLHEGKSAIWIEQFATWTGGCPIDPDRSIEWIPAYSYMTQHICYVPAAAIFSCSPLNRGGLFEKTRAGSAAGLTFQEVFTAGLLSALAYEQLNGTIRGRNALVELDQELLQQEHPDLAFLLHSAQRFAYPFAVLKVAGDVPVHTILAVTLHGINPQIVTIGTALSATQAATNALLDLVGSFQLWQEEPRLPAISMPLFPTFTPYQYITPATTLQEQVTTLQQVVSYLQVKGDDILFVNTTASDIRATGTFISGAVLLARRERVTVK